MEGINTIASHLGNPMYMDAPTMKARILEYARICIQMKWEINFRTCLKSFLNMARSFWLGWNIVGILIIGPNVMCLVIRLIGVPQSQPKGFIIITQTSSIPATLNHSLTRRPSIITKPILLILQPVTSIM